MTVYICERENHVRPALADKGAIYGFRYCFHHVVHLNALPNTSNESAGHFPLAIR